MSTFRFAVSVMPREGILDPQGRAVETSLPHLDVTNVHGVRVGRRVELSVDAADAAAAHVVVERLAGELFANPLLEDWSIEALGATAGSAAVEGAAGSAGSAAPSASAASSGSAGA